MLCPSREECLITDMLESLKAEELSTGFLILHRRCTSLFPVPRVGPLPPPPWSATLSALTSLCFCAPLLENGHCKISQMIFISSCFWLPILALPTCHLSWQLLLALQYPFFPSFSNRTPWVMATQLRTTIPSLPCS